MDFVFDRTAEGRSIKSLTVVDDATHEAVAIVPERAMGGTQLVRAHSAETGHSAHGKVDGRSEATHGVDNVYSRLGSFVNFGVIRWSWFSVPSDGCPSRAAAIAARAAAMR